MTEIHCPFKKCRYNEDGICDNAEIDMGVAYYEKHFPYCPEFDSRSDPYE